MRRVALACVLLASCRSCDDAPKAAEPVEAAAPIEPKHTAKVGGTEPVTRVDVAKQRAYLVALDKGRKLTVAKKWPQAIGAFGEAVKADPHDARAYAERGYAELLSDGDLAAASADLDRASTLTNDPTLLSQIWFDRGLVDEKTTTENAVVDFWVANQLKTSPAAQKKIAGKKVCPVRVVKNPLVPARSKPVVEANGWLGLERATAADEAPETRPLDEDSARRLLTGIDADPPLPRLVTRGEVGHGREVFLVAKLEKGLRAVYVGGDWGGRCPGESEFAIAGVRQGWVHVHGRELGEGGYTILCFPEAGAMRPCASEELDEPDMPMQSGCVGGTATIRDVVVDTTTGRAALVVERPELRAEGDASIAEVTAKLVDGGLSLTGAGCDSVLQVGTP